MRAWLYLIAAAVAGVVVTGPAVLVFVLGGDFEDAMFAALATLLLVSGLAVVTMRDIIRCGLAMIVCFLALAGIYVLAGATLVAATQVLVYVGAISVLVLFAIMLTQSKVGPSALVFQTQRVPATIVAIVLAVVVAIAASSTDWHELPTRVRIGAEEVARVLFDQYVLPFEVIGVLLLAAVVGGLFIAKREPDQT